MRLHYRRSSTSRRATPAATSTTRRPGRCWRTATSRRPSRHPAAAAVASRRRRSSARRSRRQTPTGMAASNRCGHATYTLVGLSQVAIVHATRHNALLQQAVGQQTCQAANEICRRKVCCLLLAPVDQRLDELHIVLILLQFAAQRRCLKRTRPQLSAFAADRLR